MGLQVDLLTKGKTCHAKEFIDFEFNGKHISEFGLVVVSDGDRLSFDASPNFDDETSTVNGVSGQYYWGTNFKTLTRTFSLATDGMTEAQVNAFKLHFRPGKYGKFIEDKLPFRYGYCRVSDTSTFEVVPFRKTKQILGRKIQVNEYKGEASLTFEWDYPYMYATKNYLPAPTDENYNTVLRALYTDGIPLENSWTDNVNACIIGDDTYSLKNGALYKNINYNSAPYDLIFYNPSTAPTDAIITLTLKHTFTNTSPSNTYPTYFSTIADDINKIGGTKNYNSILITGATHTDEKNYKYSCSYTSPNVIYSINRAIQIAAQFYTDTPTGAALDLEEKLRLEIVDNNVMGWAASVLNIIKNTGKGFYDVNTGNFTKATVSIPITPIGGSGNIDANWFQYFNLFMLYMLGKNIGSGSYHLENASWIGFDNFKLIFNGVQNSCTMVYNYNQITNSLIKVEGAEKTCGDCMCSSYLILDGGDTIDNNGKIASYHYMSFTKGDNNFVPENVTLIYNYTYL